MTVLEIQGELTYTRPDWTQGQPVQPATQLVQGDQLAAAADFSLEVLCAAGDQARSFTNANLQGQLSCDTTDAPLVQPQAPLESFRVTRGGVSQNTPYVISPRATAVRNTMQTVTWNPIEQAIAYRVRLFADGQRVWDTDLIEAEEVTVDGAGRIDIPDPLESGVVYTLEICAFLQGSFNDPDCTSDAEAVRAANLAFYYVPNEQVDSAVQALIEQLGDDTASSLYARAVVLSQPDFQTPTGESLGYYSEAITLLEQLKHMDHPLARSAEMSLLLGKLYQRVDLPERAFEAYAQAAVTAAPDTETQASALIGQATTSATGVSLALYEQGLAIYESFLDEAAFQTLLQAACSQLADRCAQLSWCVNQPSTCEN